MIPERRHLYTRYIILPDESAAIVFYFYICFDSLVVTITGSSTLMTLVLLLILWIEADHACSISDASHTHSCFVAIILPTDRKASVKMNHMERKLRHLANFIYLQEE